MFRNTLCEAEPDEPGERSAFGAIRTGIELCERQPRQSSGSIGQPDLAPNAMPDTVLIVPAAGMRRIVAHRAEVEMPELSFSPPNSPTLGIPVVLASRESYGRLRIASGQRRRLKQQEESGSGLVRKPAADRTGRQPDAYIHAVGTDGPQQEGDPQRRVRIGKSHRTEQRQLIARDELPAAAGALGHAAAFPTDIAAQQTRKCARSEIRAPRSTGRRPVRRQSSTVPDLRRQRTPRRAMPSNQAFPIARRVFRNAYRTNKHAKYPRKTKRSGRHATTAPEYFRPKGTNYPIRVSPCQLI